MQVEKSEVSIFLVNFVSKQLKFYSTYARHMSNQY